MVNQDEGVSTPAVRVVVTSALTIAAYSFLAEVTLLMGALLTSFHKTFQGLHLGMSFRDYV